MLCQNDSVSAQWQWFAGPKTTLSAKWLGFWSEDTPTLPDDAPANPGYINWWKWTDAYGSYGVGGGFPYVEGYNSSRSTIQGDVSHYAEGFLGEHDIKFGVQYTKGRSDSKGGYFQGYVNFLYPYRWTQNVQYMQSWYGDRGLLFNNYRNTINPFLTARTADSIGAFLDDQWTPTRRLTINLGLRFDHMTSKYGTGKVYEPPPPGGSFSDLTVLRDRAGKGIHRAGQVAAGQADLRFGRPWFRHAPGDGNADDVAETRHGACAVQRHGPGDHRAARQPDRLVHVDICFGAAAHQGESHARQRCHQLETRTDAAGSPHRGRIGRARF